MRMGSYIVEDPNGSFQQTERGDRQRACINLAAEKKRGSGRASRKWLRRKTAIWVSSSCETGSSHQVKLKRERDENALQSLKRYKHNLEKSEKNSKDTRGKRMV
ncbi:hypothetical protein CEXT_559141 [Caerostris extrusa]|uniref:Uncharacterized protein n=1 Tax=Caerostris extrusa TaxID=172846 RepID=A0AAV4X2Y2_CAEEX|nr:hypothetical protein CEXT_559141 [Caerostris extrusa]